MNKKTIEEIKTKSKWEEGVKEYALEMLEQLEENEVRDITKEALLNGAGDWSTYSYGGCALIYNTDIAERLCTPSELKKTKGGERRPNRNEDWLDVQARALYQASRLILRNL